MCDCVSRGVDMVQQLSKQAEVAVQMLGMTDQLGRVMELCWVFTFSRLPVSH